MSKKFLMSTALVFALLANKSFASSTSSFTDSDEMPSNHVATISPDSGINSFLELVLLTNNGFASDTSSFIDSDKVSSNHATTISLDVENLFSTLDKITDEVSKKNSANKSKKIASRSTVCDIPKEIVQHIASLMLEHRYDTSKTYRESKNAYLEEVKNLISFALTSKDNYTYVGRIADSVSKHYDPDFNKYECFKETSIPFLKSYVLNLYALKKPDQKSYHQKFRVKSKSVLDIMSDVADFFGDHFDPALKIQIEDLKKLREAKFNSHTKISFTWLITSQKKLDEKIHEIDKEYNKKCLSLLEKSYPNFCSRIAAISMYRERNY